MPPSALRRRSVFELISASEFASNSVALMQAERDLATDEMGGVKKPQAQLLDDQLFQFLHGLLDQVEASSGVEETELKAKIAALQSETRKTPPASTSQMSEVDLARELDKMSAKLDSLGALVEEDPEVQGLLANTADLWVPVITASAEERTAKAPIAEEHPKTSNTHVPESSSHPDTDAGRSP